MPERLSTFPNSRGGPAYNTDYTLSLRPDKQELKLTFKQSFLQAHEWSNGDISPEITFTADDGRKFGKKFSMNLKVNTAPILEYAGIGKTTESGEDYYVLIFQAKDMGTMIGTQHVHKDINIMNVTAGGVSRPPITLSVTGSDFATGGDLLAAVSQLDTAHSLPTGNGLLRLKTDVKVGGPETEYSVSIKDSQGLSSAVISAKTKKNKLADVELLDGFSSIGATPSSEGATDGNPKVFAGMSGKTLTAKAAPAGAAITGSIAKHNSDGTWTQISGGTVNGTTPVTITLPALGTGETEALYKISLKAQLSGYDDSDSKDFFVKLVEQEVPVLKLVQNFNQNHDLTLHSISAGTQAYVTKDIIPDALTYSTNPLVIYNMGNGQCKLDLSASAGATVKYRLDSTLSTPMPTAIITVPIGAHTLEVWAVKGTIEGPHTTVRIKVVNAVSNYTELKNIVKNTPEKGSGDGQYNYNNFINIKIGSAAELTADSEIAVTGGKKLMLSSSVASTVRTINANNSGRIFKISGPGTLLTLWDLQLTGGDAVDGKGGAVCVEAGGDLWLKGKTVITPSTESDINTKGKNDVYLATGSLINLDGILTGATPIVARITPAQYRDGEAVLGSNIAGGTPPNYKKFRVTQPDDGFLWTIKNDGTLQAIPTTINGGSGAWKRLKEAVQNFPAGSTITINGEIKATNATGNSGEITIDKDLTIQGQSGAGSDILNANSTTTDSDAPSQKHRIFKVEPGKKLTLKNLTLKNGKNNETDPGGPPTPNGKGGAIYSKGELEIRNVFITGCEAKYGGGGIYCSMSGSSAADERKLVIENTEVTSCKAPEPTYGTGGGVYIVGVSCRMNVKLSDVIIKNNEASSSAAGLCLHGSHEATTTADSVVLTRVTLHENKLTDTDARGGAGMVFATYDRDSAITLKNCTVTKNESKTFGGGISLHTSSSSLVCGKLILEDSSVTENKAQNGGGIYVDWSNLVIKNSILTSNTATDEGGGVYVAKGTFEMDGSATVTHSAEAHKNDVYLDNGKMITVAGSLTPPSGIAARITVADSQYSTSTQVLTASAGVALAKETYKFAVTPQIVSGNTVYWTVDGNGKLKQGRYTEVPYDQLEAYLANASSTEENYIEVTGDIPAADLKGTAGATPSPGTLGQLLKSNAYKKVALKLPSGLSVPNMDHCFAKCENLVSVENLPSDVMSMQACFSGCVNLTTGPDIPATVTHMRECFWGCTRLQSVKINCPYNTTTYAFYRAFTNCTALPNGGIKVPLLQLAIYKANAAHMGTTAAKFSAIP